MRLPILLCLLLLGLAPSATAQSAASSPASSPIQDVLSDSTAPAPSKTPPPNPWAHTRRYVADHADDYVGADERWPHPHERESVLYRTGPPLRYNRVEGVVLGLRRRPLSLRAPHETTRLYGQVGYAFVLDDLRYTIGLESKLRRDPETGLKIGVSYGRHTLPPDRWKTSVLGNSLGGLGLGYDLFDYYEAEGLSLYAVQALPSTLRLVAGFRTEEHRPLTATPPGRSLRSARFAPIRQRKKAACRPGL